MLFDTLWLLTALLALSLTLANTWFVIWVVEHKPLIYDALRKPSPLFFLTSFMNLAHPYMKGLLSGSLVNELPVGTVVRKLATAIRVMLVLFELSWIGALISLALE